MTGDDCEQGVTYFRLCREIACRLDMLEKRVKEGKALQETKDFCSFLRWSGVLKLLELNSTTERESNLPVDGPLLRWRAEQLEHLAHKQMNAMCKEITIELCMMERIEHRLDLIAAQVARIPIETQPSEFMPVAVA